MEKYRICELKNGKFVVQKHYIYSFLGFFSWDKWYSLGEYYDHSGDGFASPFRAKFRLNIYNSKEKAIVTVNKLTYKDEQKNKRTKTYWAKNYNYRSYTIVE